MTGYMAIQEESELDVYLKRGITLVRGKNSVVWDGNGKEYIDCISGHGVANTGHCNEDVIKAIQDQSQKLITCSGPFYNDKRAELMHLLAETAPGKKNRIFLCNSGTEAVEAAIKFARYTTGKSEFICAKRGFHGRTFGSLSATYKPVYKKEFEPVVQGFSHVPYNNFDSLKESLTENTAGVILEVVQGEAGVYPGKKDYFKSVQSLCRKKGILLIIDEVQTGFCRTGRMFASQHFELEPDLLCLAKAMAGGLPAGAVVCSPAIKVPVGKHGSTFGGNPLVCAAALAAINYMTGHQLDVQSEKKGDYIVRILNIAHLNKVREIRHMGLMIGIELKVKAGDFIKKLTNEGILVLSTGKTIIRLLPPLTISYEQLDHVAGNLISMLDS